MGSVLVWIHSIRDQARPSTRARAALRPPGGAGCRVAHGPGGWIRGNRQPVRILAAREANVSLSLACLRAYSGGKRLRQFSPSTQGPRTGATVG